MRTWAKGSVNTIAVALDTHMQIEQTNIHMYETRTLLLCALGPKDPSAPFFIAVVLDTHAD
jgi:hypothetical protein